MNVRGQISVLDIWVIVPMPSLCSIRLEFIFFAAMAACICLVLRQENRGCTAHSVLDLQILSHVQQECAACQTNAVGSEARLLSVVSVLSTFAV